MKFRIGGKPGASPLPENNEALGTPDSSLAGPDRYDDASSSSSGRVQNSSMSAFARMRTTYQDMSTRAKAAVVIGFLVLLPPSVGILTHLGGTPARPVFTEALDEAKNLGEPTVIQQKLQELRQLAISEDSIRDMIVKYFEGKDKATQLGTLIGTSQADLKKMEKNMPWDAKVGPLVDGYWFGIDDSSKPYHQGHKEVRSIQSQQARWQQADKKFSEFIRNTIADYLKSTQPIFASNWASLEKNKNILEKLNQIQETGNSAESSVKQSIYYWNQFQGTPEKIKQRTTKKVKIDGVEKTIEVEETVTNPALQKNKSDAESAYLTARSRLDRLSTHLRGLQAIAPEIPLPYTSIELPYISFFPQSALVEALRALETVGPVIHSAIGRYGERVQAGRNAVEGAIDQVWNKLAPQNRERLASATDSSAKDW